MKALRIIFGCALLAIAGCSSSPKNIDYDLVTTDIKPFEYGEVLCHGVSMDVRHTCVTLAMQHYRERVRMESPPAEATQGPFAMVFADGDFYTGRYTSDPFAAAFNVRNAGGERCRGRYNAFHGDKDPIFKIRCDGGVSGQGNIILDLGGRNGLGEFKLDDGRYGRIAFGYAAVDA
ncbi:MULTISPECIES: hypothetical protein [Thiorhodovibrio]|uniref:hypothetical protein n=1 Tax=Thiorhodovibrio TaxID=61593 RepID=UPI0019143CF6|nr:MULTISPECIES: hypothetical protein [Thiorhodovibrio]MBK5968462.1 hypothetical protein [Thiorhodovibrio winogradskyi]WPL11105.1 hypothetical protein Thiosp_00833 [Thiorhodovibrio litoralis]